MKKSNLGGFVGGYLKAPQQSEELAHRVSELEQRVQALEATVETLNRDLDESRRLNLRAAELMDIAFVQLAN